MIILKVNYIFLNYNLYHYLNSNMIILKVNVEGKDACELIQFKFQYDNT